MPSVSTILLDVLRTIGTPSCIDDIVTVRRSLFRRFLMIDPFLERECHEEIHTWLHVSTN